MESSSGDDFIILTCTNPNPIEAEAESESNHKKDILISTTDILSWDLHTIVCSQTLQIHANRNRPVSSLLFSSLLFSSLLFGSQESERKFLKKNEIVYFPFQELNYSCWFQCVWFLLCVITGSLNNLRISKASSAGALGNSFEFFFYRLLLLIGLVIWFSLIIYSINVLLAKPLFGCRENWV